MAFFINESAGLAFESTPAGWCKWDPKSKSFNLPMTSEEMRQVPVPCKRVSEDEAEDFARSHETP